MRQFKIKAGDEIVKAARYDGRGIPLVYLRIQRPHARFESALITPSQARRLAAALLKFANAKKVAR